MTLGTMPCAIRVLMMPIWANPRAAPPPSASPITGRLVLPSPTLSRPFEASRPRPIKLSSTKDLLEHQIMRYDPAVPEPTISMVYVAGGRGLGRDCDWIALPR